MADSCNATSSMDQSTDSVVICRCHSATAEHVLCCSITIFDYIFYFSCWE